jgi:predicted nucleic acid-binding protein
LLPILRLRGLHVPTKNRLLDALDLYVEKNISFADAFTAMTMKARGIPEVYSWDTDFDGISGISRLEPAE